MIDDVLETEDFERTLKEHADRFFLTPSERVWRSLYNDLHPGSKWPSLAVGLFMILILFWIGKTNENTSPTTPAPEKTITPAQPERALAPVVPLTGTLKRPSPVPGEANSLQPEVVKQKAQPIMHAEPSKVIQLSPSQEFSAETTTAEKIVVATNTPDAASVTPLSYPAGPTLKASGSLQDIFSKEQNQPAGKTPASEISKLKKRRQNKKTTWEYFVNPMISNVQFSGTNLNKSGSSVISSPVSKHNMSIARKLGFIAGTNAYYPLTNRLSFTSGTHLIYTGYNIYSELKMPNTTSLTFKDSRGVLFSKNYVSYYSNEKRKDSYFITNYNWQLSLPVGFQWDILSNQNVKISVVSTIEPFMVLGSKAYLLSGDASSYVTDPDLVRKFNLSGNIGSVVTFSSSNVNWRIGPNLRYQILSTYNDIYPVKEHFVNYGVHIGISKK